MDKSRKDDGHGVAKNIPHYSDTVIRVAEVFRRNDRTSVETDDECQAGFFNWQICVTQGEISQLHSELQPS